MPAFGRRRRRPRLGGRHPAPRGRVDVHRVGHVRPRAVPGPRRRRAGAAQGRAGLPEPDAQPVGRPRRGVHALAARPRTAPGSSATCCSRRTRSRGPAFDPSDAADLWDLVNRQDWAICESVQRGMSSRGYTQGWFAPMEDASLDIRRWLLPRLGASRDDAGDASRSTYVVVGLGGARQRHRLAAGPARARRSSGSSSSSSGTRAAPRTTRRGSCGAATTRRPTSG